MTMSYFQLPRNVRLFKHLFVQFQIFREQIDNGGEFNADEMKCFKKVNLKISIKLKNTMQCICRESEQMKGKVKVWHCTDSRANTYVKMQYIQYIFHV